MSVLLDMDFIAEQGDERGNRKGRSFMGSTALRREPDQRRTLRKERSRSLGGFWEGENLTGWQGEEEKGKGLSPGGINASCGAWQEREAPHPLEVRLLSSLISLQGKNGL